MDILQTGLFVLCAIAVLSLVYRVLPHKPISARKPRIAMFPKYLVQDLEADRAGRALEELGFRRYKNANVYVRGHYMGDFSARWVRLNAVVKEGKVYLHAPLIGILFDTGDLWEVATALSDKKTSL